MSRILMVAVLAILLGLLAVMANIVNPKPAPPPTPEQHEHQEETKQAAQKSALESEKKERAKMMEMRKKMSNEWQKKQQKLAEQYKGKNKPPSMPTAPGGMPSPVAMDITHEWFKKQPDGEKGLQHLEKVQKQLEEQAKEMSTAPKPVPQKTPMLAR